MCVQHVMYMNAYDYVPAPLYVHACLCVYMYVCVLQHVMYMNAYDQVPAPLYVRACLCKCFAVRDVHECV